MDKIEFDRKLFELIGAGVSSGIVADFSASNLTDCNGYDCDGNKIDGQKETNYSIVIK